MYDSANKRFMSEDLIKGYTKVPSTLAAYNYCIGNPLSYVDLDGMAHMQPDMGIISIPTPTPTPSTSGTPPVPPEFGDDHHLFQPPPQPPLPNPGEEEFGPDHPRPELEIEPLPELDVNERVLAHRERDAFNTCPIRALDGTSNNYRGVDIYRIPRSTVAMGWEAIYLGSNRDPEDPHNQNVVLHEWGHHAQWRILGDAYLGAIGWPSYRNARGGRPYITSPAQYQNSYFMQFWEVTASMFGGVPRRGGDAGSFRRTLGAEMSGLRYLFWVLDQISRLGGGDQARRALTILVENEGELIDKVNHFPLPGTNSINHARGL